MVPICAKNRHISELTALKMTQWKTFMMTAWVV